VFLGLLDKRFEHKNSYLYNPAADKFAGELKPSNSNPFVAVDKFVEEFVVDKLAVDKLAEEFVAAVAVVVVFWKNCRIYFPSLIKDLLLIL
jgi:hypothetical protein